MSYFKLIFNFIKYFIIKNPVKVVFSVIVAITFNYAGTLPGEQQYVDLVSQSKDGNTYIYIVKSITNTNSYDIWTSNKQMPIKNNQLSYWNEHDGNILLWILFGIITLILSATTLIGIINDDDDVGWDIEYCYQLSLTTLIYCELENDTYYYMIMGRLIEKRKDRVRSSNLARELRISSMSDVFRLPKFSTKTQKRNNILDKLGII